jgi:short-subunit dehydrogenase/SAM-dependent methyltransferase
MMNPRFSLADLRGGWALVTGASAGIGLEYCRQLARADVNLVLVARRKTLLEGAAVMLRADTGIAAEVIDIDLTSPTAVIEIQRQLATRGIRIRLLVNNAGSAYWGPFTETSVTQYQQGIALQVIAMTQLLLTFSADLRSFPTSAVINVSSRGALFPTASLAVYCALKAYTRTLSLALHHEWAHDGVLVQCVTAGPIRSHAEWAVDMVLPGLKWGTPEGLVARSLAALATGQPEISYTGPLWPFKMVSALLPMKNLLDQSARIFDPQRNCQLIATRRRNLPVGADMIPLPSSVQCRICAFTSLPAPSDVGYVHGNTEAYRGCIYRLWRCPGCGSINAVDPVDLQAIYRHYPLNARRRDPFAKMTLTNLMRRLRAAGMKKMDRILDYGCGNGLFIEHLKEQGYARVVGYDPFVAPYTVHPSGVQFDWVVINDTLEHVEAVAEVLSDVASLTLPGGHLYIGVPDTTGVDLNDIETQRTKMHQPYHRVIPSFTALTGFGRRIGFETVRVYRRSYLDTRVPFANYRFLDELCKAVGHSLERALDPGAARVVMRSPRLLFFGVFGYFFPSADEPAVILRRPLAN